MNFSFSVYGHPEPQGSTKAFTPKGWTRPVITTDNPKVKPWRQDVAQTALELMAGDPPSREAIILTVRFYFARPTSLSKRILHKTTKPDIDKVLRSILDSLTGIVFADDAQVIQVGMWKGFGAPERAEIDVSSVPVKSALDLHKVHDQHALVLEG